MSAGARTGAAAELIEDLGAAAADAEFFRSREFLDAEGVTHSLRIVLEDAELRAPLIVREIPGSDLRDAVSPYGYPGLSIAECRVDPAITGPSRHSTIDPGKI